MRSTAIRPNGRCGLAGVVAGLDERAHAPSMLDSRTLVRVMTLLVQTIRALFRSRADLALENLALRQQVAVLKQQRPRPPLTGLDRALWVALQQTWKHWANALIIVQPETVVKWHRKGFKLYWRWKSRPRGAGRPQAKQEVRDLIRRMAADVRSTILVFSSFTSTCSLASSCRIRFTTALRSHRCRGCESTKTTSRVARGNLPPRPSQNRT